MNKNNFNVILKKMSKKYPAFDTAIFFVAFNSNEFNDESHLKERILEMVINNATEQEIIAFC